MSKSKISSVRELVDAFGGTGALARFLNIVPSAVSNMLAEDYIPRGYHLELYLELERRGLAVDKSKVFGIDEKRLPKRSASAVA